jgi:uncharacterized RDD family membrane protein YckC
MSEHNPYQTPTSDVSVTNGAGGLAGRWVRLGASFIDGLVVGLVMVPVMYLMGFFSYFSNGAEPPLTLMLMIAVIAFISFVAINYVPLNKTGQTVGKKLVNIRITDLQGNKPDVSTIILKRYLPVQIAGQVPIVGGLVSLVDALFIFRKDRRCVHDLIAGTQVMYVNK